MIKTVITSTVSYVLTSYGNGWAYELKERSYLTLEDDWPAIWVQDDDAISFRQEWASLENAYPNASQDYILADLWGQYAPDHTA